MFGNDKRPKKGIYGAIDNLQKKIDKKLTERGRPPEKRKNLAQSVMKDLTKPITKPIKIVSWYAKAIKKILK
jgi:hypothetical protein